MNNIKNKICITEFELRILKKNAKDIFIDTPVKSENLNVYAIIQSFLRFLRKNNINIDDYIEFKL